MSDLIGLVLALLATALILFMTVGAWAVGMAQIIEWVLA